MKLSFLALLAVALYACNPPAEKKAAVKQIDPAHLISCEGIGEAKLTDSYADLERKFGAKSLSEHENTEYGVYTSIWDGEPNHIKVFWKEKKRPFKHIKYLEISDLASAYLTKDSLQVGLTLRELVKVNGFVGINFNSVSAMKKAGLITSFNGGQILKNNPCLAGVLAQAKVTNVYKEELETFRQKANIHSSDNILNRIEMELAGIRIFSKQ